MLSNEQYQHFQTFGFVILRQFFTADEMATLREEFETGLNLAYAHRPFDGSERHWVPQMGPSTPLYASLLEDERFWSITAQLYGEDAFAVGVDANRYVGDTRWHPDHRVDPTQDCYGIKFAFYLDSVGPDTGALRLVPARTKTRCTTTCEHTFRTRAWNRRTSPRAYAPPSRATSSPLTCAAGTPASVGSRDAG